MTNILDSKKKQTYLLILNGNTMQEVARVGPTPHMIPHGYHGAYFDKKHPRMFDAGTVVV